MIFVITGWCTGKPQRILHITRTLAVESGTLVVQAPWSVAAETNTAVFFELKESALATIMSISWPLPPTTAFLPANWPLPRLGEVMLAREGAVL